MDLTKYKIPIPDRPPPQSSALPEHRTVTMISDDGLYSLAVFLGSLAMLLIVLYHWLEINAQDDKGAPVVSTDRKVDALPEKAR
jgi:hypothetical protein